MNRFLKKEDKELFSKSIPVNKLIEQFKIIIEQIQKKNNIVIFESLIMKNNTYDYFLVSVYTNVLQEESTIQLRLDLKYNITAPMHLLQNLFFSNREEDFWDKINKSNLIKYISDFNIKPYDLSILEIEI